MILLNNRYNLYKKFRKTCLSCGSAQLKNIFDLGLHSFADRFVKKKDLKLKDPVYPLVIDLCIKCSFIQSKYITNPKDRYLNYEYSYTSSNSIYSKSHWESYAVYLNKNFDLKGKKILEIGSNDGILSDFLKKYGADVFCVDASPEMIQISKRKGLKSIRTIFNKKNSKFIKAKTKTVDIIIANNVFNHSDDPSDFLSGVHSLLKNKGLFIFEQPYFLSTLVTKKFDQIYHEHISYFTAKNIEYLLKTKKFQILNILKNSYHGGSLRTISIKQSKKILISKNFLYFENQEKKNKIYNLNYYKKYFNDIVKKKFQLHKQINFFKKNNYKIVGVGAGAKTNTFLTFNKLDNTKIDYITDSSRLKINKYTPLTRIKICNDSVMRGFQKIACIILSWNIERLLKKKLKKINHKIKYIKI
jgi:2-polyprenyl-3-methyl-5-hydroxy-6-metoxy-1,4-benzoquinol methylase